MKKTKIQREELLKQLESVLPGLALREIIEQSSCFVFQGNKVYTYNDEVFCSQDCCMGIEGAIQAAPLIAILRKLPDDELSIEYNKKELSFKGKGRKTTIAMESEILLPIDDIEKPKKKSWKDLPKDFTDAVSMVQQCSGKNEDQFELTCIHLHPKYIEACDSLQVARYKLKMPIETPVLVRKDSLKHVTSLEMNRFTETKNWIHFKNEIGLTLSCKRFVEEFPKMGKILKLEGKKVVLPKGLKDACERAGIFSIDNVEENSIDVKIEKGKVRIEGRGITGKHVEIKKVKYDGPELKFSIPPQLLTDIIQRHNECQICGLHLKIKIGKFTYVTSLGETK